MREKGEDSMKLKKQEQKHTKTLERKNLEKIKGERFRMASFMNIHGGGSGHIS